MKNFLQFIIPLLILLGVGTVMLISNNHGDDTKRLYIKCNSISKNYEVFTGSKLFFAEGNEKCELNIKVLNVSKDFIKIETDFLWQVDEYGELDKSEAREINIIQTDNQEILYSYDEQTKYIFTFK